jgi:hypothetical protein
VAEADVVVEVGLAGQDAGHVVEVGSVGDHHRQQQARPGGQRSVGIEALVDGNGCERVCER